MLEQMWSSGVRWWWSWGAGGEEEGVGGSGADSYLVVFNAVCIDNRGKET